MFRGVATARSALGEGAVAVVTGDPQAARPFFDRAADAANDDGRRHVAPLDRTGRSGSRWLGDNIKAVEAVAEASEQSAGAGLAMVGRGDDPRMGRHPRPRDETLGAVDLPTLRAATPKLDEVAKTLGVAEAQLSGADTGRLVGPIATGYEDALDTLPAPVSDREPRTGPRPPASRLPGRGWLAGPTCWRSRRLDSRRAPVDGRSDRHPGRRTRHADDGWTARAGGTRLRRRQRDSAMDPPRPRNSSASRTPQVSASWTAWC